MPSQAEYKAWARRQVTRTHGKPLNCPVCEAEVFIDEVHTCPPGFVKPASSKPQLQVGYGYNALNRCCRDWILVGWPEENGKPKDWDQKGPLTMGCKKCLHFLYFDLAHPDIRQEIHAPEPHPVAVVAGRIR